MVSTRKKRQSNRRLLSQLDDFDRDIIIGDAASARQENIVVNEGTNDQDFTAGTSSSSTAINESMVNVKTLERCFNERIDRETSNIVDTVEDRTQNAILTAIDNIVAPKIEIAIRSLNASSGRDVTSVTANWERGEHAGINAPFGSASGNNNILHVSNVKDETRHNIPDEVCELSVPETHFDRQAHTHHSSTIWGNFSAGSSKLHSTCPEENFVGKLSFWKKCFLCSLSDSKQKQKLYDLLVSFLRGCQIWILSIPRNFLKKNVLGKVSVFPPFPDIERKFLPICWSQIKFLYEIQTCKEQFNAKQKLFWHCFFSLAGRQRFCERLSSLVTARRCAQIKKVAS